MKRILLKATVQGLVAATPFRHRLNRVIQEYITHSLYPPGFCQQKREQAERHIAEGHGGVAVELGAGYSPIVSLLLAHAGYEVHAYDLNPLMKKRDIERATLEVGEAHFNYRVDDVRRAQLPEADLFVSNNVLEHVPAEDIVEIYESFRLAARPGAVMSHFINTADHYSQIEDPVGFLRSRRYGWPMNNRLHFQNRLRPVDHLRLTEQAGWIVRSFDVVRSTDRLPHRIDPRFSYTREELSQLDCWIVSTLPDTQDMQP